MPNDPGFARGQDVNGANQPVGLMRYSDWARLGFCYGWVEYLIGSHPQPDTAEHRRLMREAGYLTGAYAAISPGDAAAQAELFLSLAPEDDELPHMLDVEVTSLSENDVRAWCDFHDAHSTHPLVIYTGLFAWPQIVTTAAAGRYKKYKLVIGQYPHDTFGLDETGHPKKPPMDPASIALRSDPPANLQPSLPQPWTPDDVLSWQYTGHGSLPGLSMAQDSPQFVDLHFARFTPAEFRRVVSGLAQPAGATIPSTPTPPQPVPTPASGPKVPIIAKGTKLGIGQIQNGPALNFVRKAAAKDAPLAGTFGMDNAGVAISAKDLVPFRLTRIVQGTADGAPGMDANPSDDTLRHMAAKQIERYVHLNAEEKAAATFVLPWNEPRPTTVAGYVALTRLMFFTADACEANNLRFLAYALNAGTPEWDETLAMWSTIVNGAAINARLIRGGHGIAIHMGAIGRAGVQDEISDRIDDRILGAQLQQPHSEVVSPFLPNADPLVLRYRFLKLAADQLGIELAPIFATEFYHGLKAVSQYDPEELVRRYEWLDNQLAQDAYFRVVFPYAVGSSGAGMPGSDHAPIWDRLVDHAIKVKDRINATADTAVQAQARWWEAWPNGLFSTNLPLPTPTHLIPMRNASGEPFPGVVRQNPMEARERQGNLFRVLDEPIDGQMWWVMAEDLPAPAG